MKRVITVVMTAFGLLVATGAMAADAPLLFSNGAQIGAAIALCPDYLKINAGPLITKYQGAAAYKRWRLKNEFDRQWRADKESAVDEKAKDFGRTYFHPGEVYVLDVWKKVDAYDFGNGYFPWDLETTFHAYLNTARQSLELEGMPFDAPKSLAIAWPMSQAAGTTHGLVPCLGKGACLKLPEQEAGPVVDPVQDPDRMVVMEFRMRIASCKATNSPPKLGEEFSNTGQDSGFEFTVDPVYIGFHKVYLKNPGGDAANNTFVDPRRRRPLTYAQRYNVGDVFWYWHAED